MGGPKFKCLAFEDPEWNGFVEQWAPVAYRLILQALGPFDMEPGIEIVRMSDGMVAAGANASFDPSTGRVTLSWTMLRDPGMTLEKVTHEFVHASLRNFPDDIFYDEGYVDYSTWLLAHAPLWGEHRQAMIDSAAANIRMRRERAMLDQSDMDRKRWAGGLFAMLSKGPHLLAVLRQKKLEGNRTW